MQARIIAVALLLTTGVPAMAQEISAWGPEPSNGFLAVTLASGQTVHLNGQASAWWQDCYPVRIPGVGEEVNPVCTPTQVRDEVRPVVSGRQFVADCSFGTDGQTPQIVLRGVQNAAQRQAGVDACLVHLYGS